jgi:hypothetical protein
VRRTITMGELLPLAFGADSLAGPGHDDGG